MFEPAFSVCLLVG